MKAVLSHGSVWPVAPLSKHKRIKDIIEALQFGIHRGAEKQHDLLRKLVKDNVNQGFALLFPLDKIVLIAGILLALLNVQLQKTINKCGKIIPKNRLTQDQSLKWQSGILVNSRINSDQQMLCYFEKVLKGLINWAVAARGCFPTRRILATKLDVKAPYRRCHLNAKMAVQTCTTLSSEGLTLMMLCLTFSGAPFPSE
jgi:hypothetical protein